MKSQLRGRLLSSVCVHGDLGGRAGESFDPPFINNGGKEICLRTHKEKVADLGFRH